MWKRLALLWAVTATLVIVLFLPIQTHTVALEMPRGAHVDPQELAATMMAFSIGVSAVMLLAILGVSLWLSLRIVRRYRKSV